MKCISAVHFLIWPSCLICLFFSRLTCWSRKRAGCCSSPSNTTLTASRDRREAPRRLRTRWTVRCPPHCQKGPAPSYPSPSPPIQTSATWNPASSRKTSMQQLIYFYHSLLQRVNVCSHLPVNKVWTPSFMKRLISLFSSLLAEVTALISRLDPAMPRHQSPRGRTSIGLSHFGSSQTGLTVSSALLTSSTEKCWGKDALDKP